MVLNEPTVSRTLPEGFRELLLSTSMRRARIFYDSWDEEVIDEVRALPPLLNPSQWISSLLLVFSAWVGAANQWWLGFC